MWLLTALAFVVPVCAADRKPNFLFIYTDDQRWDAMGVVQREQGDRARFPWFKSPGMDRLAAEGVRFRNAFVTLSLCSPSRAAFLTGCYNHQNGVTNNNQDFPAESVTHATLLRAAGYRTAYIGKWHMGDQRGQRPGFDYSASFIGHGQYQNCPFEINGVSAPTKGWVDDVSTDFAIAWMKENKERPFSMVVGFKSPHNRRGGNNLPERLRDLYAGETSRSTPNCGVSAIFQKPATDGKQPTGLSENQVHLDYLRHIRGADENVVRLLDTLDALGLAEDTVVVYASDNGFYLGEHCSGDKRSLYEESLRIPLLVRYPRLFSKGAVVDEMVLNVDLAPTFLDLAGVPVPQGMQGVSWKELAAGHKPARWRTSFFAEYYKELGDVPTCYAVRTATHKLVKYPNRPEWTELFDLTADPYEIKNLASDAALTAQLEAELQRMMKMVNYTPPASRDEPPEAPPEKAAALIPRETRSISGWQVHIQTKLLKSEPAATEHALLLLKKMLDEIVRVVPGDAVAELRKVPLYFSPAYKPGGSGAEFHPEDGWLRDNGRDPVMARGVEFSGVADFEAEMNRMPNFALHELAHAYHLRVLKDGFANAEIVAAYDRAKASGSYEKVERWHGNGKPNTHERAYAMTDPMEYFAESTEAFFGRNDFFPFTREDLKAHDPAMLALLEKLWGTAAGAKSKPEK
ncbi:MAG: sulfatase-like hydrolase/transferase [Chthoniobacter sp.]|nr:sulfatase-like hydrolase/transferase [Chthoniobacter sp.]